MATIRSPLYLSLCLSLATLPSLADEITLRVPASDSARLVFPLGGQHQVELSVTGLAVSVTVDGQEPQILIDDLEPTQQDEELVVSLADYNFDDLLDVGVLEAEGYGGVNRFTSVFIFDAQTRTFSHWLSDSNIVLDAETREIHTGQRSGPRYMTATYRLHQGRPYVYQATLPISEDLEKVTLMDVDGGVLDTRIVDLLNDTSPALRDVTAERAYFHSEPDEATASSTYIVRGDQVELLDSAGDWDDWLLVRYRGSNVYERWIKAETVAR